MRKLMLSLVFVLGATTMVNANSNVIVDSPECFHLADMGASVLGTLFDLSYAAEHEVFNMLYDKCVEQL